MPDVDHLVVKHDPIITAGDMRRHDLLDRLGRASLKERLPELIISAWRSWVAFLELLNKERKYIKVSKIPLVTRFAMWRRGFLSESFTIYQLVTPHDADRYLSDYGRHRGLWGLNRPFEFILDDKLVFWGFLRNFSSEIAPVVGLTRDDVLYCMAGQNENGMSGDVAELRSLGHKLILKPLSASGGIGIMLYEWRDGRHNLNGKHCSADELRQAVARGQFIVCPFVEQAAYANRIFPATANSIRILTLYDSQRRECFIAAAAHRFGVRSGSKVVDNWVQGGVAAGIDLSTGRLATAYAFPRQGRLRPHARHPDTDEPIEGVQIANWPSIKQKIVALGNNLPFLRHVGWDVIATDQGFVIIEGNNRPAVNIVQLNGGLLADPRVAQFYSRHGVR